MADNTVINSGSGGDIVRTLDRGGVKTQVAQIDAGGAAGESLVSASNPLPTAGSGLVATGTITAAGQTVSISDLKGCASVRLDGARNSVTVHTGTVEVLTASGVWHSAKFAYATAAAAPIGVPATLGATAVTVGANNIAAIIDTTGCVGVRWRSITFTGSSFAVTLSASPAQQSRIAPDLFSSSAVQPTNMAQLGGGSLVPVSGPPTNASNGGVSSPALPIAGAAARCDVGEAAPFISSSGATSAITDSLGGAISAVVQRNSSSGSPLVDLVLQESYDDGTSWFDVYHFERLGSGSFLANAAAMPPLPVNGRRRWAYTFGGSGNLSLTIKTARGGNAQYPRYVQFFDRTAGLLNGTLDAASGAYLAAGCKSLTLAVTAATITTTPGTYVLEGSMDGSNWYPISAPLVAAADSTVAVASTAGMVANKVRARCSSAASGQTGTVVAINGVG